MQKPTGVGNPACVSLARFAAFGPTWSGSVALRSLSGRIKRAIRNSFGLVAAHSLSPEGRGWGEGARASQINLCFRTPSPSLASLTWPILRIGVLYFKNGVRRTPTLSPLGRGENQVAARTLSHMIAIAR